MCLWQLTNCMLCVHCGANIWIHDPHAFRIKCLDLLPRPISNVILISDSLILRSYVEPTDYHMTQGENTPMHAQRCVCSNLSQRGFP